MSGVVIKSTQTICPSKKKGPHTNVLVGRDAAPRRPRGGKGPNILN